MRSRQRCQSRRTRLRVLSVQRVHASRRKVRGYVRTQFQFCCRLLVRKTRDNEVVAYRFTEGFSEQEIRQRGLSRRKALRAEQSEHDFIVRQAQPPLKNRKTGKEPVFSQSLNEHIRSDLALHRETRQSAGQDESSHPGRFTGLAMRGPAPGVSSERVDELCFARGHVVGEFRHVIMHGEVEHVE
jgi:hypothetical protein